MTPDREQPAPELDLGSILRCFPYPAVAVDRGLSILAANDAYLAAFSPTANVIGRSCHSVSHATPSPCEELGEACPVRTCFAHGTAQREVHVHATVAGRELDEIRAFPILDGGGSTRL